MSSHLSAFLRSWVHTFFWIGVVPASIFLVLALIPGGQMLSLIPAYLLSLPGALLVGPPHFSPEFGIAMTLVGFWISLAAWIAISALLAYLLTLGKRKARAAGEL